MASELKQHSQFSLSMLMSNLPGMVYRCLNDRDWTMEFVSEGCLELTGYKPSDLIGNKRVAYNNLIHPDDQPLVREQVQKALEVREPFRVVYRIQTAAGEEKWVWEQGQGVFSKNGELIALEGFITNITERSKAEEALKESEARIRAILETAVDGIITINATGIIESVNSAVEKLFGYTENEVIGKNVDVLMPSPYREDHDTYLANYLKTGEKKIIGIGREVVAQRKDGITFPIRLSVSEFFLGDKRMFTGIVHDISEEKALQQQILHSERLAIIGKMAAKVAHEVRNPLSSVSLNAELLEEEIQSQDSVDIHEAKSLLKSMIREIDRVTLLTDEYLQFSRLPESQPIKGNLNSLLKEMLKLLVEEFNQKNIKLTSKGLSKELQVRFDRAQLRRVFLNIIRNAIESMPDQGTLNIWTERNIETAIIGIQDSGHGIPEDKVNEIFNPFFTTKDFGTGLGLAISQQIIHEHKGQIYCESKIGQGTTFRIELPLNENP
ncbi:PAS domain S-box protein [candidate division KSB1 bacterium]|nr:PAS domain S-box protein [candidate division KSB1 bacterium]